MTPLRAALLVAPVGSVAGAQQVIWEKVGPPPSAATLSTLFPSRFHAGEDVNGDGVPDVVTGAPYVDSLFKGTLYVVSGSDGSVIHEIDGDFGDANLGIATAFVGDWNADGVSEFASATLLGSVEVFSGADGSLFRHIPAPVAWDYLTWDPLATLHANADGILDLALGCWTCSPGPLGSGIDAAGAVAVVSGADGSPLWVHAGSGPYDRLGWSLRRVGDLDHDGVDDLIAGAPGFVKLEGYVQAHDSYALVLSGATGQEIVKLEHTPPWQPGTHNLRFGSSVEGIDADHDGVTELLVGHTYGFMVPFDVSVYDGSDWGLLYQSETNDGATVRSLGDADGDGFADYLACYDKTAVLKGEVLAGIGKCYVTSGEDHARILELTRQGSGSFGDYAELLGDVDKDGFPDVAIGDEYFWDGSKVLGRLTAISLIPKGVSVLGEGCPGYQGVVPRIGVRGTPALGGEVSLFLSQASPGVPALLGLGTSELVPPLDLAASGLPGCQLYIQLTSACTTTTDVGPPVPGRAAVGPFPISDDASLLGTPVFAQFWVDGASGFPPSVSRALRFDLFAEPYEALANPSAEAGRLLITGITPSQVAAFGATMVTLNGSGFLGVEQVHVGSEPLGAPFGFTIQDDGELTFNSPLPAALGAVQVTVETSTKVSNAVELIYVPTDPPQLTATAFAVSGQTCQWTFGGLQSHTYYLSVQLNDATTIPFAGYQILGGAPLLLTSGVLDGIGLGNASFVVPPGLAGALVYSQIALFDPTASTFTAASNVAISTVLF